VAAAAAALLQLRLLEVFFFLPAPQFWAHCHGHLLHLCCRQLMGTGGSRVNPGAGLSKRNSIMPILACCDAKAVFSNMGEHVVCIVVFTAHVINDGRCICNTLSRAAPDLFAH
jgi:hypothetical protein